MKKILMFFICLLIGSVLVFSIPTNIPNPGTKAAILNSDNSLSVFGNTSNPSQVGIKSLNSNNYLMLTGPDNANVTYSITFPNAPTNGVFVATVSNGTNVVLSEVAGVTQTLDVITAGASNTTNRLYISSGIITNIVQQ
jgi:hypothetical protein